jgi:predicted transcriptional regulator
MTRKRSRLEIYLDVLRVIKRGVRKPTRIMYSCNLSWKPLQEILTSMINQELVSNERIRNANRYDVTEKGVRILKYFNMIEKEMFLEELIV